jgi:hypothetical protein
MLVTTLKQVPVPVSALRHGAPSDDFVFVVVPGDDKDLSKTPDSSADAGRRRQVG